MLIKLLKYDFKSLFKLLVPIYLISFLIAFISRIFSLLSFKISLLQYPAGLATSLCFMMIIGVPIATFIISVIRYYNNMVKDEGYLTHTLPVKKRDLVLSKLIISTIAMAASVVVSIATIFLAFNINDVLFKILGWFIDMVNNYDKWIILIISILLIVSYISYMLLMYTSISLGQKHNGNKAIYSVIYGIVIYNATQVLSALILFIPALFTREYFANFDKEIPEATFINGFLIFLIVINLIICFIYYIINVKSLDKKLNLD